MANMAETGTSIGMHTIKQRRAASRPWTKSFSVKCSQMG